MNATKTRIWELDDEDIEEVEKFIADIRKKKKLESKKDELCMSLNDILGCVNYPINTSSVYTIDREKLLAVWKTRLNIAE